MSGSSLPVKSWQQMREWQIGLLERSTGTGLAEWNERIHQRDFGTEADLRAWLKDNGVTGYAQMLLVHETFGYPEFLTKSADDLIAAQYEDRPALRPILDAILARLTEVGEVTIQVRKTFVALVSPRRTFARVTPTTRSRVDLSLRLPDARPGGRLLPATTRDEATVRMALSAPDEVDGEVIARLREAYAANG